MKLRFTAPAIIPASMMFGTVPALAAGSHAGMAAHITVTPGGQDQPAFTN